MLKKVVLSVILVFVAFLTGYATAQSFLGTTPGAASGATPAQTQIMSPGDFQSQSQKLEQQKNEALTTQLKANLAKVPPPPPPTPPPTPAPATSAEQPQATPEGSATEAGSAATPATSSAPAENSAAAIPEGPTPTAPAKAPPSQSNVYTGFQNQSPDQNPKQPAPSPGSGNWNIKY